MEVEISWVEVDGAGWSWLEVDGGGWSWVEVGVRFSKIHFKHESLFAAPHSIRITSMYYFIKKIRNK